MASENGANGQGRTVSRRERIAAAQARVSADKKRGVATPEWILELARQEF